MELAIAIELDGVQNLVGVADRTGKVLDSERVANSRASRPVTLATAKLTPRRLRSSGTPGMDRA